MHNLEGQCAVVTGAGGSIGQATAKRLTEAGASVVLADLRGHDAAAESLSAEGHIAIGEDVDVTSEQSVRRLTDAVLRRFGRLDILVNGAGVASALKPTPFEDLTEDQWRRLYDVNVMGVMRMCAAASAPMRAAGSGRIINLTSGVAYKGTPGLMHYVATKGALISVTRSLASEFAPHNVLVNAVSPGFTITESMKAAPELLERFSAAAIATRLIKREATPDDVAKVICFLAGPQAGFVTGQVIAADGGSVFH